MHQIHYPTIFNNCFFFHAGKICDFRESTHPISSWDFLQEMRLRKEMVWDLGRISGMEENLGQSI